jgi:hypothetical protein
MLILCLFVWHCYCFVLHLLDTSFYNLNFFFTFLLCYSSHCSSSVVPFALCLFTLLLLTCCRSSRIVVLRVAPLVLLFSHYNYVLLFLRYSSSPNVILFTLLLLSLCFSHLTTPLTLPLPLCHSSHVATPFMLLLSHCRSLCVIFLTSSHI